MAQLAGKWTLKAIGNEAGWTQGIAISGSMIHDGIHVMAIGTVIGNVEGESFRVEPKAFNPATNTWVDSLSRDEMSWDAEFGVVVTIFADDNPPMGDGDFNDLVILCISQDDELQSPISGFPRLDLSIPEQFIRFG